MLFHPTKVPLKVFSISFKVHWRAVFICQKLKSCLISNRKGHTSLPYENWALQISPFIKRLHTWLYHNSFVFKKRLLQPPANKALTTSSQFVFVFLLQQDSLSLTDPDSGISESCDDTEEAILTKMKLLAQDLEQKLSLDSNLVQEIAQVKVF